MRPMLAVLCRDSVTVYRVIGRDLVFWLEVHGTPAELRAATEAAQRLDLEAAGLGGWLQTLCLGLNAAKPVHSTRGPSGIFRQNYLNRSLRKL